MILPHAHHELLSIKICFSFGFGFGFDVDFLSLKLSQRFLFHRQSQFEGNPIRIRPLNSQVGKHLAISLSFNVSGIWFLSLGIITHAFKRLQAVDLSIFSVFDHSFSFSHDPSFTNVSDFPPSKFLEQPLRVL